MGYFDEAKAAREEENSLEHSSGTWKKHKYIQKIGEGASAKYKYAKDKVKETWNKDITGKDYLDEAGEQERKSKLRSTMAKVGGINETGDADLMKSAEYHGRKAAEAESAYYTKSLAGKSAKTVAKGKALIKDFFTPKTTVKTSSNLRDEGTTNVKNAERVTLKKNKLSIKKN